MAEKNILSSEHDQLLKEIVIDHDFDLFKMASRLAVQTLFSMKIQKK